MREPDGGGRRPPRPGAIHSKLVPEGPPRPPRTHAAGGCRGESGEAITDADPRSLTWRGSLMLISSLIAARCQDRPGADQRLGHAQHLAERLGADANIGWTAFGPTNVLVHRMSAAVALEDPQMVSRRPDRSASDPFRTPSVVDKLSSIWRAPGPTSGSTKTRSHSFICWTRSVLLLSSSTPTPRRMG